MFSYVSLLFFGILHSDGCIFPLLLCLLLLLFSLIFIRSHETTILFFVYLFLGDGFDHCLLYNVTTSIHSSSGTLFIRSILLNLFVTSTVSSYGISFQFSSVAQSCPTLCDPMDCSMPGFPVHHQLQGFAQTHVHLVGGGIQPSHPVVPFSSCPQFLPATGSFPMSPLFT